MMDCQANFAGWNNGGWGKKCWLDIDGLPDDFLLPIDQYSHDVVGVDIGPRKEEKAKGYSVHGRGPKPSLLIQLAFHDCLRYDDGSGGCDGCLNWKGVGYISPKALDGIQKKHPEWVGVWPKFKETNKVLW